MKRVLIALMFVMALFALSCEEGKRAATTPTPEPVVIPKQPLQCKIETAPKDVYVLVPTTNDLKLSTMMTSVGGKDGPSKITINVKAGDYTGTKDVTELDKDIYTLDVTIPAADAGNLEDGEKINLTAAVTDDAGETVECNVAANVNIVYNLANVKTNITNELAENAALINEWRSNLLEKAHDLAGITPSTATQPTTEQSEPLSTAARERWQMEPTSPCANHEAGWVEYQGVCKKIKSLNDITVELKVTKVVVSDSNDPRKIWVNFYACGGSNPLPKQITLPEWDYRNFFTYDEDLHLSGLTPNSFPCAFKKMALTKESVGQPQASPYIEVTKVTLYATVVFEGPDENPLKIKFYEKEGDFRIVENTGIDFEIY